MKSALFKFSNLSYAFRSSVEVTIATAPERIYFEGKKVTIKTKLYWFVGFSWSKLAKMVSQSGRAGVQLVLTGWSAGLPLY